MHPTQKQAPPVEVTPADTLRAAATYLDRYGWIQDDYYSTIEPVEGFLPEACALGAIGMAAHGRQISNPEDADLPGSDEFLSAQVLLHDYLIRTGELPDHVYNIGDWNDHPDQTLEAVIATLRAAADDWDRIHGGAR